jgi:hypothetical protein
MYIILPTVTSFVYFGFLIIPNSLLCPACANFRWDALNGWPEYGSEPLRADRGVCRCDLKPVGGCSASSTAPFLIWDGLNLNVDGERRYQIYSAVPGCDVWNLMLFHGRCEQTSGCRRGEPFSFFLYSPSRASCWRHGVPLAGCCFLFFVFNFSIDIISRVLYIRFSRITINIRLLSLKCSYSP